MACADDKPDNDAGNRSGDEAQDGVHSAREILDKLREEADKRDEVHIGDVVEAMGSRSFGPFLVLPALIEMTPIGAVPGVPTFLATIVLIAAVQLVMERDHLWLPGFIANRSRKSEDIKKAADKLDKAAGWLDRWFHQRLTWFAGPSFQRAAAVMVIILALTVPALEFVPFASTVPMAAIAAFGLALLVRDGLLMLVAGALSLGALGLGINYFASGGAGG